MIDVSYVPGNRTAVVGDRCWVLIDAAPDSVAVQEIWQRIEQSSSLDALLSGLLRLGFGHVPGFALLAADGSSHHVICRGGGSATLITDGSHERVDGTELATWREHPVAADVACVILGDPPADDDLQLPASAGVFLAHSIRVALLPAPSRRVGGAPPARREPAVPEASARAGAAPDRAASASDARTTVSHSAAAGWVPGDALPVVPGGAGHQDGDAFPAEDTGYDFLFAATQARTIEDAAVRPAADIEADGDLPSTLQVTAAEEPPPPQPPPPLNPAAPAGLDGPAAAGGLIAPGGLIDAVPWATGPDDVRPTTPATIPATRPPASPGQPRPLTADSAAPPGDDTGLTVKRSDLPSPPSRPVLQDRIGPTVHAVLCPGSHPNPPSSASCRMCDAPLPQQDPVTVPRPVLGVLRLSTGDVITLDRGVIMGRNPGTDFGGGERPHVVKLPSGDGEISRTHLQISLDGWHVLVTDLKSTNGTLVALPGRDPEQLRPNEPLLIQPGTLVTLADGIDFRYEVTQ
jgi:FHA domain-containing protein